MNFDQVPYQPDVKVNVIGYAQGQLIEALAVEIDGKTRRLDGSFYHVTLSLSAPRKPVDSNTLINLVKPVDKIQLHGEFKLLDK